jgi:hypothetical protein
LAASRDADKTFKEQVCRPQQKILEKKLSKIISSKTDIFNLKLNELSLTDEDTQSKIDERYLRFGVLVPNEPRRRMGMDNLPNGDKTFLEAQGEQAESLAQQQAEQQAQTMQSRTRDQDRSANATDSNGEGRNAQGDGRAQA